MRDWVDGLAIAAALGGVIVVGQCLSGCGGPTIPAACDVLEQAIEDHTADPHVAEQRIACVYAACMELERATAEEEGDEE